MPLNRTMIETVMENHSRFSGVVYVRENGRIIFSKGYGYANRADEVLNTINTRFGIASGAKLLTGVAICQLVEQGKLTFESRLRDVVDAAFPHFDPSINVRHLLTHTSGAPDYFDEELLGEEADFGALWLQYPTYTMRSPRDFLPMFQNAPMKFKPGERFSYNNGGYILLGLIIEAVSGQPYVDYVTQHVLQKAGMTDSGFFLMNQLPARTALGYVDTDDNTWHTNIFEVPIIGGADGGVFVTAPDMGRFWDALLSHQLLSQDITNQFLYPHTAVHPNTDSIRFYGYGIWVIRRDETIVRYYGVGSDPGVSFISTMFPDQRIEITVISNSDDGTWPVFGHLEALI